MSFLQDFSKVDAHLIKRVVLVIDARLILRTLWIHQARLLPTLRGFLEVRDLRIVVDAPGFVMMQARFCVQLIAN